MPQQPAMTPPPRAAIREQLTPVHTNGYYAELVNRNDPAYQAVAPIRRGTLYSTIKGADPSVVSAFPNLYFVREFTPLGGGDIRSMPGDQWVILYWATDVASQDSFNAAIDYLGDAVACPTFTREYVIRRDTYAASPTLTTGAALTSLIGIKVTAGGTGYKTTDAVNIAGSLGAEAVLVVDTAGTIISVIVTKSGSGYDSASLPAVTITTTTGSGATLAALVQPKAAVLTSQKKVELPPDDPMANEFVKSVKIYETLPGPYIPANRNDPDLGVITGRRRAVLNSAQAATVTSSHSLRYEGRDGSSIVSWEIEESWDNTAFPTNKTDFYDDERGAVHQTGQLTTDTTTAGSLTAPSTTATKTRFEPYKENPSLRLKIIETWTVPGPIQTSTEFERDGIKKVVTRQQMKVADVLMSESLSTGPNTWVRKFKERINEILATQVIETLTVDNASGFERTYTTSIKNLIPEVFLGQIPLLTQSTIADGFAASRDLVDYEFEHTERQLSPIHCETVTAFLDPSFSIPVTISGGKETNDKKQVVTVAMKLCADSTTPTVPTALIDVDFKKLGNGLAIEITKTIASVFAASEFSDKSPSYPSEYVTDETTVASDAAGTASAPTAPAGGSATQQQLDAFVKRTTTTTPTTSSPLTEAETNQVKQKVTVVRTLGGTAGSPSATVDVEQRVLPGGRTESVTKTITGVFDATVFAKQRGDAVPERFKKATPEITEKHVVAGTASAPSLSSGDTAASEQQKDAFVKETSVTNRAVGGYSALAGQDYDETLDIVLPYTESVGGAGGAIGTPRTQVTPLGTDIYGSDVELAKTIDVSAATAILDAYMLTFPGSASLDLPDELTDLTSFVSVNQGDGSYSETANATGDINISLRGSGQGSVAVVPSIIPEIRGRWGRNVPTTNYVFLLPSPVSPGDVTARTGGVAWPKFAPQAVTIVTVARQISLRADASAQRGIRDTDTVIVEGIGSSREVGLTVQHTHIPPTIHDSLGINGEGAGLVASYTASAEAHAHIDVGPAIADISINGTAEGHVLTTGIAATSGATSVPTSGVCVLRSSGTPYKYGYVMMHVETVDFADV